jgi:tetratricopeptide (TPR) repeat protein
MRKSNIATDAGDAASGLGLANAALRDADRLTPGLRAVAMRQRAHAHAIAGEHDACARSIEDALAAIVVPGDSDTLTAYCTPSYVEMEAANAWVELGRADKAVPVYERGLQRWPEGLERDRGLCLSRLAVAQAELNEVDLAAASGRQAAAVVRLAPSARAVSQLRRLRLRLAPHRSRAEVAELESALTGVA